MFVSLLWNQGANDTSLWAAEVRWLWRDKVYVPEQFRAELRDGAAKKAYFGSLKDSRRNELTRHELCCFEWSFRFKETVGGQLLVDDPWSNRKPAATRAFAPDGSISPLKNWCSGTEKRFWKFVSSTQLDCKQSEGACIQVNDYPPYQVFRYHNWGFIMHSCWVVMTSFPMPLKGACPTLEAHIQSTEIPF